MRAFIRVDVRAFCVVLSNSQKSVCHSWTGGLLFVRTDRMESRILLLEINTFTHLDPVTSLAQPMRVSCVFSSTVPKPK